MIIVIIVIVLGWFVPCAQSFSGRHYFGLRHDTSVVGRVGKLSVDALVTVH